MIFDGYEVHEWKPGEISLLNAERYLRHILTPEHFEQLAALEWVEEKDVDVDRCATSSVPWIVDPSPSAGGLARTGGATLVEAVARARGEGDG